MSARQANRRRDQTPGIVFGLRICGGRDHLAPVSGHRPIFKVRIRPFGIAWGISIFSGALAVAIIVLDFDRICLVSGKHIGVIAQYLWINHHARLLASWYRENLHFTFCHIGRLRTRPTIRLEDK